MIPERLWKVHLHPWAGMGHQVVNCQLPDRLKPEGKYLATQIPTFWNILVEFNSALWMQRLMCCLRGCGSTPSNSDFWALGVLYHCSVAVVLPQKWYGKTNFTVLHFCQSTKDLTSWRWWECWGCLWWPAGCQGKCNTCPRGRGCPAHKQTPA